MSEVRGQTLSGDVQIDGVNYIDCLFRNARLVYSGGFPPGFANCGFDGATFAFEGAAGYTLSFLRAMSPSASNLRSVVLGLLPELND